MANVNVSLDVPRSDAASISLSFLTWYCDYAVCMVHLLLVVFLICLFIFTILASESTNNEGVSLFLSRIFFVLQHFLSP